MKLWKYNVYNDKHGNRTNMELLKSAITIGEIYDLYLAGELNADSVTHMVDDGPRTGAEYSLSTVIDNLRMREFEQILHTHPGCEVEILKKFTNLNNGKCHCAILTEIAMEHPDLHWAVEEAMETGHAVLNWVSQTQQTRTHEKLFIKHGFVTPKYKELPRPIQRWALLTMICDTGYIGRSLTRLNNLSIGFSIFGPKYAEHLYEVADHFFKVNVMQPKFDIVLYKNEFVLPWPEWAQYKLQKLFMKNMLALPTKQLTGFLQRVLPLEAEGVDRGCSGMATSRECDKPEYYKALTSKVLNFRITDSNELKNHKLAKQILLNMKLKGER